MEISSATGTLNLTNRVLYTYMELIKVRFQLHGRLRKLEGMLNF